VLANFGLDDDAADLQERPGQGRVTR
jgi:hypothetical protein